MKPLVIAMAIFLLSCRGGGSEELPAEVPQETPVAGYIAVVPVRCDTYYWISVMIDGTIALDAIYDTGAPFIFLPPPYSDGHVTVTVGNYSRRVSAYELSSDRAWTGALVGNSFFEGATKWDLDCERGELRVS